MKLRFKYGYSHIYGWTVYDIESGHYPAYLACDLLLPHKVTEWGEECESPVMLESDYQAMRLCSRLNHAWRLYQKNHKEEL